MITLTLKQFLEILFSGHRDSWVITDSLATACPGIEKELIEKLKAADKDEQYHHVEQRPGVATIIWRKSSWNHSLVYKENFRKHQAELTKKYITHAELKRLLIGKLSEDIGSEITAIILTQKLLGDKNKDTIVKTLSSFDIPIPDNLDELLQ